ncbi:hypothetical protein ACFLQ2_05245 [archaeon]
MARSSSAKVRQLMLATGEGDKNFKFTGGGKYPGCFGKYPDCPEEAKAFAGNKNKEGYTKMDAPSGCRVCPLFKW